MNCKCKRETLTVPRGNDFKIHLCRNDIAPANPDSIDFNDIVGLKAYATRNPDVMIPLMKEIDSDGDLIITITAEIRKLSTYGVELVGSYQGNPWRWKCCEVFKIADCNCQSTVQGMESFGVETYYIWDTLDFEIEDDTLKIISDGHAWIDGDVLHVMDTETTTISFENDKMIVTN